VKLYIYILLTVYSDLKVRLFICLFIFIFIFIFNF